MRPPAEERSWERYPKDTRASKGAEWRNFGARSSDSRELDADEKGKPEVASQLRGEA